MANTIVVVGAGVSGLTSALLLSKSKGNTVIVVAKHMPGDYDIEYTSPWAGANVLPMATEEKSGPERRTWPELRRLAQEVPEAGIHIQKSRVLRRHKDLRQDGTRTVDTLFARDPWYKDTMDDYRELDASELPAGADSGCEFTSVCINVAVYLPWLVSQCSKAGVVFKRAALAHISEAKSYTQNDSPADIIVNATGLGSHKLGGVEDQMLQPIRGQTVLVRNECTPMTTISGTEHGEKELMYIMQRAVGGGTILGGTYDLGNWESVPDPNIALRIMQRAVEMRPDLADGKGIAGLDIIRHAVGLRPHREDGVRIEKEILGGDGEGNGTVVVHNYGHSGWGYQGSYGCAEQVVQLVNEIRKGKGETLDDEPKLC